MNDRATEHRRHQRTRDRAKVLLILGTVRLMPPLAAVFDIEAKIAGIPATLAYLFGVWALLIIGTASLTRSLGREDTETDRDR